MKKWQSIDTAPKDGTVVLTDDGSGRYIDQKYWDSPVTNGWYLCTTQGDIPHCADDGMAVSSISPKLWIKLPLSM